MLVPVWITADFICPWCWIGEKRLFDAITGLPPGITVEVRWLPFELNPDMPPAGLPRQDYRIAKFGSLERAQAADATVAAAGRDEGLVFDFDRIDRTPATGLAHRLVHWAQGLGGCQRPLVEALFRAYFQDGRDLGRPEDLVAIAVSVGLDGAAAAAALASEETGRAVRALAEEMVRRGIQGVPFFNIWGVGASGAVPAAMLQDVFDLAIARRTAAAAG